MLETALVIPQPGQLNPVRFLITQIVGPPSIAEVGINTKKAITAMYSPNFHIRECQSTINTSDCYFSNNLPSESLNDPDTIPIISIMVQMPHPPPVNNCTTPIPV